MKRRTRPAKAKHVGAFLEEHARPGPLRIRRHVAGAGCAAPQGPCTCAVVDVIEVST